MYFFLFLDSFLKNIFNLFVARGGGGEEEKHQYVVASFMLPTGDMDCNPAFCPDWKLNWQPFGLQAGAQSIEPHQPGLFVFFTLKNGKHKIMYDSSSKNNFGYIYVIN